MSGRTDVPGPNRRLGPRPLLFHLAQAAQARLLHGVLPVDPPRAGSFQTGSSQTGSSQTGRPDAATSPSGTSQTATSPTGAPRTGTPLTETPPTGTLQTSTARTGTPQTGTPRTGAPSAGTSQAQTGQTSASGAWPPGWTSWSESWPAFAADRAAASDPPFPLPDAALLAGIAAYRRHPFERRVPEPPCIWQEGGSRLLDYGRPGAPPVLFVPSLVNRAYVLDLFEEHSMLRFLAAGGVRPLLLDWGWPDEAASSFTLTDYIAGRLERAVASVGVPVTLAGYCMGGLMAVAAAARRPDLVARLVLLATPWDFWADDADAAAARRLGACLPMLEPAMTLGALPVDVLQLLFSLAEPGSVAAKYRDFGTQDQHARRAEMFVAVEDWLNDGVPLAAAVAREVIAGWYGANTPARGMWRCAGLAVRPPPIPSLIATGSRDRLVPPASALALAAAMPDAVVLRPEAGHVGLVAGAGAPRGLWAPLLAWLRG